MRQHILLVAEYSFLLSVIAQAVGPGLNCLVIDQVAVVHIVQSREGQLTARFFLINSCDQGFLDDRLPRAA